MQQVMDRGWGPVGAGVEPPGELAARGHMLGAEALGNGPVGQPRDGLQADAPPHVPRAIARSLAAVGEQLRSGRSPACLGGQGLAVKAVRAAVTLDSAVAMLSAVAERL